MLALRPSAAGKWFNCTGSPAMEAGRPEGDTSAADEGTVAHWIAAKILHNEPLPEFDTEWEVVDGEVLPCLIDSGLPVIKYTKEMLEYARKYTDYIQTYTMCYVERPLGMAGLLGYDDAAGTPDAITYNIWEVKQVHDLKYGFNPIEAKDNLQLLCYAWADYQAESVKPLAYQLIIHQPRIGVVDVATYSVSELEVLWADIKAKAGKIQGDITSLVPGGHCGKYYCKAQAVCPALHDHVMEMLPEVTDNNISAKLARIPTIRKWCDAVEEEAYHLAVDEGQAIPGFKVVDGRQGNRQWSDKEEAEKMLKEMRVKHDLMYKYDVISPTTAEKLFKEGVIGKRQWPKLEDMIIRADGKPTLVPESDKRKAIEIIIDLDLLGD